MENGKWKRATHTTWIHFEGRPARGDSNLSQDLSNHCLCSTQHYLQWIRFCYSQWMAFINSCHGKIVESENTINRIVQKERHYTPLHYPYSGRRGGKMVLLLLLFTSPTLPENSTNDDSETIHLHDLRHVHYDGWHLNLRSNFIRFTRVLLGPFRKSIPKSINPIHSQFGEERELFHYGKQLGIASV